MKPEQPTEIPRPAPIAYASAARRGRVWGWVKRYPLLLSAIGLCIGSAIGWQGWQWRLRQDKEDFDVRAKFIPAGLVPGTGNWVNFDDSPSAGSLRHAEKIIDLRSMSFRSMGGENDASAWRYLRGRRFPYVTGLAFRGAIYGDGWVAEIAGPDAPFPALTTLALDGSPITDAGLKALGDPNSSLKGLTTLNLKGTRISDAGMKELARPGGALARLAGLDLSDTAVGDAGVKELGRCDSCLVSLATLDLHGTKVTDQGLKDLVGPGSGLKLLSELNVSGTRVDDAALGDLAGSESGATNLHILYLRDTQVTPKAAEALQKARPELSVFR